MSEFADLLVRVIGGYVPLKEAQVSRLEAHYEMLVRWNRKMNLTAIRTLEETVTRHYAESLYFGAIVGALAKERLGMSRPAAADIGSGAGFPGFPLAVLHPEWPVTLIESHRRKAVFLSESSRDLPGVRVLCARAENIQERFDLAVSRAVDPTEVLGLRLARATCLLAGEDDVPRGTIVAGLPWGRRRVITFHVEQ